MKGAAGIAGVGILAEAVQQYGVLQAPDGSDGFGRMVVEALDGGLADRIYGESSSVGRGRRANAAGRRMAGIRGSSLPTEVGSGRLGFGIGGPQGALDAVPLGSGGGGPQSASPVDAGAISEAQRALAAYRAELASLKTDMSAAAGLDLPGLGESMERRKTELEGLISGMESKLQSLGAVTIAPKVDAGSIQSATQAAQNLLSVLQSIPGAASTAVSAANGAAGAVGNLRACASARASFSDGVTPGASAQ
ncbi:hypothetical protein [Methylobacterium radiotolerans]|uniref:hypothetical protein n=1 Tax=Methylobacterium radiotolerans TaxID=31998 RepID=UPI0015F5768A|nr:hypothetical protein [Methylobacterium radiotolerans]